ncbi:MAG: hypothetical protein M3R69_01945 [Acidobacteriota bacterium]|nr:hypothetical protein [Acidobacteriota bacterium]
MKFLCGIIRCLFLLTLIGLPVFAQQNGALTHFAKDGLVFDYPATTKLEDLSNANGQHLVMLAGGSGAQIMIISRFDKIASTEQLNLARHDVVDAFVEKNVAGTAKAGSENDARPRPD